MIGDWTSVCVWVPFLAQIIGCSLRLPVMHGYRRSPPHHLEAVGLSHCRFSGRASLTNGLRQVESTLFARPHDHPFPCEGVGGFLQGVRLVIVRVGGSFALCFVLDYL